MKIKLPWWAITQILIKQIKKLAEDIERDRADGEITRQEWENLLAENLFEIIPDLVEVIITKR